MREVARYCPNCGAENQEGAAFCSNCGRALPQEPPQQDQQGTPPAGTPPADASPATPASPTPQSPQSAVTPPARRSRTGLYVGCGVAAVLGLLAVLVVAAVIFFFVLGSASGGGGDGGGGEITTPDEGGGEVTTPDEGGDGGSGSPPPDEGSLDEIVQEQVGDFKLEKVEEIPPAREKGVTDALQMEYTASDGTPLLHLVGAFDSADSANQLLEDDIDRIRSEGFEVVDEGVVESQDGEELGNYVVMQGEIEGTEVLSVLWTNGNLEASALAPGEGAVDFYSNSEY